MSKNVKRLIPFFLLLAAILVVYLTGAHEFLTLGWLQKEEHDIARYAAAHPFQAVLIYLGIYILSVCLIIPDSTLLTLLGGMIFPLPLAITYAVLSETIGAMLFFLIFQTAFGSAFLKRERPFLSKLRWRFQKNAKSYLLFLRLSHVVPFWLTNVAAAYFHIKPWTFLWTTFVGVIPLTAILANAGSSLSSVFTSPAPLKLSDIFTTEMKVALLILGVFALCPIIYQHFLKRKKWRL